jgi:drug/metabolite transporter (DMT)-like permease
MDTVLPALIVLVNWTLPSFVDKKTLDIISPRDLTLNRWIIGGLVSMGILVFLGNSYDVNTNKKTYNQTLMLVLLSILSHFMYYKLLRSNDASTLMIILNPLNILAAAFIGWYLYGERFNREMWIGVFGIVAGLIVFLKGKTDIN